MTTIGGLPLITLSGGPAERGEQHGTALKERIQRMIEVYGSFFGRKESEIFDIAKHFKSVINEFSPDYGTEIEAIADAAKVNPLWIYALNARSEFLSFVPATECTVMHFAGTPLLGQNWDWEERLEPLIALARIERTDGPSILMMTEPGILGKIGLNDAGVGVCFNFLHINRPTNGVPIHILLRAILECSSIEAVRDTIKRAGPGRSANILVADESGNRFDMEFAATEQIEVEDPGDVIAHTNHYLDPEMFSMPHILENSTLRLNRAYALAKETEPRDRAAMVRMLSDTENPGNSICQTYRQREPLGNMGTVCTLTMNLAARNMDIRLGNDAAAPLERVNLHAQRAAAE
ncbi:C45 family autoproteolytic acyltransferase/hydolase [Parvibaculaceae bacterium PLY_AMNH_Bact1]|nr:C45 family autoproteolytic acyltransferase/hydolase [Parvibaculaceae bacterium PLY_AMNH_Bact1]